MEPVLQPAPESDIDALIALEKSVADTHLYSAMLEEQDWIEEFKTSSVFFIQLGEEVVGNLSYELKTPDHLYISGLVIKPEFQRQGIARKILEHVLEKYSGIERVDLVTHPDNPALTLYQSLGFEVESRKENYWGEGEPRLVLARMRSSEVV